MTYREEFPDFELDLEIPAGWRDISWGNDACPSWQTGTYIVFVDYADPDKRELSGVPRFCVRDAFDGSETPDHDIAFSTDDWARVLEYVSRPLPEEG